MPATEPIQGGPYPEPSDPPDGPNQMAAIAVWAAGRLVMRFASPAARDAAIPTPTEGMEAFTGTGATSVTWVYQGAAWQVLWRPTTSGAVTGGTGWTSSGVAHKNAEDRVNLTGALTRTSDLTITSSFAVIGTVPAGFEPDEAFICLATAGNVSVIQLSIVVTGAINARANPSVVVGSGSAVSLINVPAFQST